jgi:uncharacterized protein
VQSATGFGFALVLGPALFAVLDPEEALFSLLVLAPVFNLLILAETNGRRSVRLEEIRPVLVAAVPGLALGVVALALLSKPAIQIAVGLAVLLAAAVQAGGAGGHTSRRRGRGGAWGVGMASGVLTTSTSVSGPPVVLWLRARGLPAGELRASLAAVFLALNLAGAAAVAIVGGASVAEPGALALLFVAGMVGHLAGARVFRRVDPAPLSAGVLVLAGAAGLASLVAGLVGL